MGCRALALVALAAILGCTKVAPVEPPAPRPAGLAPPSARPLHAVPDPVAPRALLLGWRAEVADVLIAIAANAPAEVSVYLLAGDGELETARQTLRSAGRPVHVLPIPVQSPWPRDWAGVLSRDADGRTILVDARYDASRPDDDAAPRRLAAHWRSAVSPLPLRLDGGNLVVGPAGLCFATRGLLTRNPDLDDAALRVALAEGVGCARLVLLPALRREPTGHADLLLAFVGGTALVAEAASPTDRDGEMLDGVAETVGDALEQAGAPPRVVRLPLSRGPRGEAMSHVQVLPLGPRILVPDYLGDAPPAALRRAQALARGRLAAAFPNTELVPIRLRSRAELGGGLHCYAVGLP